MKFYRGSEGRPGLRRRDRSRADDYYLGEGTGVAAARLTATPDVVQRVGSMGGETYEQWVAGIDVDAGSKKGRVRAQPNPTHRPRAGANPGDEMLTLQEACRYLRIPEGTLRYWRHLGSGPRSFKIGRHVRYWRTDLILWLTEQTDRAQSR